MIFADIWFGAKHSHQSIVNFELKSNFRRSPLQGQTLNHVGLCLKKPVFTHGQLYVALSRVTYSANLRMIVPDTEEGVKER
jgi:hypothetical protein